MAEPSSHALQKLERELEQKLQQEAEDRAIEEAIAGNAKAKEVAKAAAQQPQPQPAMGAASAQADSVQPDISSKQAAKHLLDSSGSPFQNGKSKVRAGLQFLTPQDCHHFHQKAQRLQAVWHWSSMIKLSMLKGWLQPSEAHEHAVFTTLIECL